MHTCTAYLVPWENGVWHRPLRLGLLFFLLCLWLSTGRYHSARVCGYAIIVLSSHDVFFSSAFPPSLHPAIVSVTTNPTQPAKERGQYLLQHPIYLLPCPQPTYR